MKILLNNNDLNEALKNVKNLSFVPTMGSLHNGHKSLINESKKLSKNTIVSLFVNPTQFNNRNDFFKYPRNNKKDLLILKKLNVKYVYIPKVEHIYGTKSKSKIKLNKKDRILCAKYRKGHFEGVLDVMNRLTKLISPKKIFMGEKDFQQFYLVKKYIEKKYKCKIVLCKTVRNKNGLALSSRNLLLNKKQLLKAEKFSQILINLKKKIKFDKNIKKTLLKKKIELSKLLKLKIEYLEIRNTKNLRLSTQRKKSKMFVSFYINKVRLIDNF